MQHFGKLGINPTPDSIYIKREHTYIHIHTSRRAQPYPYFILR